MWKETVDQTYEIYAIEVRESVMTKMCILQQPLDIS